MKIEQWPIEKCIDYDRAVEDGFVKLAKGMMEQAGKIKASDHA